MKRPPQGIYAPVTVQKVRDGDTVEVCFPGSQRVYAVRLLDCWAPEIHGAEKPQGLEAKAFAERCIAQAGPSLSIWIPFSDPLHLLSSLTFDRILAHLFLTEQDTLSEAMVRHGYATKEKVREVRA